MPSGVKIKRGDGAPAAGADGSGGVWPYELAWDYTNNKLYINDNGTMREIGGGEVSAVANGSDNRIATFSSSTALNGEANLTFDGSTLALTGDLNVDSNTLFVDSSEDSVGIGTTSPGALLTLYKDGTQASSVSTSYQLQTVSNSNGGIAIQAGASSKAMLVFGDNGDYDAGKIEYHNSTHHMDFTFNGTKRIEFMDDGQIHWGSAAAHGVLSWDTGRAIVGSSGSNNLDLKAPSGYAVVVNEAGSNVDFRVEGDSNANLLFTDAGNDRVGIGTNSPSARFHVSADAESVMWFQNGSTSNVQSIEMDASRFYFYNRTASAFNSIAVLNSGSVGIGAISPSQKLEVAGTIKATGTGGFTIGNVADVARIQESSGTFTVLTTGNAYANLEVDDLTTAGKIIHEGDTDTYMTFSAADTWKVYCGGDNPLTAIANRVYVNATGANGLLINNDEGNAADSARIFFEGTSTTALMQQGNDFSIRSGATTGSSSGTERFFVNSSGASVVGDLSVSGNSVLQYGLVVNEGSHDADFRAESNGYANALKVDAGADRVDVGVSMKAEYGLHMDGLNRAGGNASSHHLRTRHNILTFSDNTNWDGAMIINTDITRASSRMCSIHVQGYAYGEAEIIDFTISFYTYSGTNGQDGVAGYTYAPVCLDRGTDGHQKFVGINSDGNVAIAIDDYDGANKYYYGFKVTLDNHLNGVGHSAYSSWTVTKSTTDGFGWLDKRIPVGNIRMDQRNVGIGLIDNSTTPDARLVVSENGGSTDDFFKVNPANGHNRTMEIAGDAINVTVTGGSSTTLRLNEDGGDVAVYNHLIMAPTKKLYLDNGGDTYIFEESANNVMFKVGNNNNLRFNSTGAIFNDGSIDLDFRVESNGDANMLFVDGGANRVGIGTGSPDSELHVSNNTANLKIESTGSGNASYLHIKNTTNQYDIYNNAGDLVIDLNGVAERMRIDSNGTLCIGHTSGWSSTVLDLGATSNHMRVGGTIYLYDSNRYIRRNGDDIDYYSNSGSHNFTSGNVLIGHNTEVQTIGQTAAFQVLGTGNGDSHLNIGRFSNNASAPMLTFTKSRSGTIGTSTVIQNGDACGTIGWAVADGTDFESYIAAIGTHVDGTPGGNDVPGRIEFNTTADGSAGSIEAMRLDSSQDAHFDQDVIAFSTTPSDIRLKKNFTKIENGLDIVLQLEGHTFNWKKERSGERLSAGFKAQEVEKILPHLVDEKKLPLRADDDKEYKILRYEEMIPYLVEAIKELKQQIQELKNG